MATKALFNSVVNWFIKQRIDDIEKFIQNPIDTQDAVLLSQLYRSLKGQEKEEEYQAALQRKLNLDHGFSDGKKFLAEGKPSEADACFAEALKHYKDEKAIFGMMARAMMDAGEYVRAIGHARAGLKELPDDAELTRIVEECTRLRQ